MNSSSFKILKMVVCCGVQVTKSAYCAAHTNICNWTFGKEEEGKEVLLKCAFVLYLLQNVTILLTATDFFVYSFAFAE